jgi:glycosyltransferase involved in cell wall biosynthesis
MRFDDPEIHNREELPEWDLRWGWADSALEPGLTAVMRVKNEARSLPFVLPSLLRAVQRVIVVDNDSDDGTPEVAGKIAAEQHADDRVEIKSYPFRVSRCGPEHLHTPVDSVHSLAYFYNWSFSGVRTAYSLKWDGDMVLTDDGIAALRRLAWQLEDVEAIVVIPRHPLYVADEQTSYFDLEYVNLEPFIFPNRPPFGFVKAFDWELRMLPAGTEWVRLQQGLHFELKWLDSDEFAHWSVTDFDQSVRVTRKRRELQIFRDLAAGRITRGLTKVAAPAGVHVVEYVRKTWLPAQPRPIISTPSSIPDGEDAGPSGSNAA